jgi:ABC-2 type transport system ATP-binding protein
MSDLVIEAKDLTKHYGDFVAIDNLNFEVKRGEIVGLLGPNGAGKSTTMKILTCYAAPTAGSAKVNGRDVFEEPLKVREAIGYLPESNALYTEMLVYEYLEFAAEMRGLSGEARKRQIKRAVEQTSLGDVIGKEIRALSKGYRQRVGLAQALVHEPPLLILDEPMSGLDPIGRKEIRDLILRLRSEGKTVFMNTHILSDVELVCDRVAIIARGRIVHEGEIDAFLGSDERETDIVFGRLAVDLATALEERFGAQLRPVGDRVEVRVREKDVDAVLQTALESKASVVSITPQRVSLESVFLSAVAADSRGSDR